MINLQIENLRAEGLGYKRIAAKLGMSENTVKSYCRRNPYDSSTKVCQQCGKPIKNTPHKKEKKFCSNSCRHKWWNSHTDLIQKKAIYRFSCAFCGREFESYGNNHRKYCSRTCFAHARIKGDTFNG